MLDKPSSSKLKLQGVGVGTGRMAGRGQEEEEECEDCKLQTILRVIFLFSLKLLRFLLSSGGDLYHVSALRTYPWAR